MWLYGVERVAASALGLLGAHDASTLLRFLSCCEITEYVLTTIDKIANWGRAGSMWPMTFGYGALLCLGPYRAC